MSKPNVGFIGLGIMGAPMARNLIDAGYSLTVWNRSQARIDAVAAHGATAAGSAAEVAAKSDIIITIVTDSPDVESVVLGPHGVIEGAASGSIVVDMTTMSPAITRDIAAKLAENGVQMLDAPVSGGDIGAQNGTLSIMVGGPEDAFNRALPLFEVMGQNIVHASDDNGLGQYVKLCNQVAVVGNLLAACEAMALGKRAGLDLDKMVAAISKGAAGSWALTNLAPRLVQGDWEPGFMVDLQQKDLRLVLEAAAELDLPLPGTALVNNLFRSVQRAGMGRKGTQALMYAFEQLGGFTVAEDE
ncbi:MAG: NAD(P)-dependent oxidoreductase [Candidatus Poribacteria bacterium]